MLPLLALLAFGSALAGPPQPPRTVLSGHVAHAPAHDTLWVAVNEEFRKVPLGPNGDFRVELPGLKAPLPVTVSFQNGRTYLYLVPGDQLHMTVDYQDFDRSLHYTGRGANANNYLAQAAWKFEKDPASAVPRLANQVKHPTTPAEMRRNADVYRQRRLDYLAAYAKAHKLSAEFQREMQVVIAAYWASSLLNYAAGQPQPLVPGAGLPAAYFDFMAQAPVKELGQHLGRSVSDNSLAANLVVQYQKRLLPGGKLSTDPAEGPRLYKLATAELGQGPILNWVMRSVLGRNIRLNRPGALAFYPTFRQHYPDSAEVRDLRAQLQQAPDLAIGSPAPASTLTDQAGKPVLLADLRGKVVYLDFWGTWCAPCMTELTAHSHALKQQFEGRDVVFVYISVGDAEARWQKVLADKQLGSANSVHLRSPDAEVPTAYQVPGYPTYWLIDRAGLIVDMQAPRPSEGARTVAAIEEALAR